MLQLAIAYFFFKKLPQYELLVKNPLMGKFYCRANTTDFMYTFFAYEYRIKQQMLRLADDYDYFFDLGACIGDYSIWMARNGKLAYAFEPLEENFRVLQKNVQLNDLAESVHAFPFGLGSREETVSFRSNPGNKGYSGRDLQLAEAEEKEVKIRVFDEVFADLNLPYQAGYIVKIDAEGMEAEVIRGARDFLCRAQKVFLVFEAHSGHQEILAELEHITSAVPFPVDKLNMGILIQN